MLAPGRSMSCFMFSPWELELELEPQPKSLRDSCVHVNFDIFLISPPSGYVDGLKKCQNLRQKGR